MRLVHMSDLHLGIRQFQRSTKDGVNQREADVAATFTRVIDAVIARAPQMVVIAGDVFHVVRPSNTAIVHAFNEFQRLRTALPDAPVIMVAGNHDAPKSAETSGILRLFSTLGVTVVDRQAERIQLPGLNCSVLAVPDVPRLVRPAFTPDPSAKYNVLLLHGEIEGMLHRGALSDGEIPVADLQAPVWTYVALGHWHVYREMAPNAYYSGAIEYTSSDPWGELVAEKEAGLVAGHKGKGFIERDLATGEHTFHAIETARDYVDVPAIDADGMMAGQLDAAIRDSVNDAWIDAAVARLIVRNVPRGIRRELDQQALKEYRARALNFHLDLRAPEVIQAGVSVVVRQRGQPLSEMLTTYLDRMELTPGVDRGELHQLAQRYLAETEPAEASTQEPALTEALLGSIDQNADPYGLNLKDLKKAS